MVEGEIKYFTNPLETLHEVVVCAYKERTARNGAQLVPTNCLLTDVHTYWILKRLAYVAFDFQWKLKVKNVAHW